MKYELINALVTPFDDNNQIDFDILKKLIEKNNMTNPNLIYVGEVIRI